MMFNLYPNIIINTHLLKLLTKIIIQLLNNGTIIITTIMIGWHYNLFILDLPATSLY